MKPPEQFVRYTDDDVTALIRQIIEQGSLGPDQFANATLTQGQAERIWAALAQLAAAARAAGRAPVEVPFRVGRITADAAPRIESVDLRWQPLREGERFTLRTPIAQQTRDHGIVLVPDPYAEFETDLTSVPSLFTWLVPRTGPHLAAALIHDGLVCDEKVRRTYAGPDVSRAEADDNFREHMKALGVPVIRRWLMWAAVATATLFGGFNRRQPLAKLAVVAMILTISILGVLATLDLFDCAAPLFWMRDRSTVAELFLGGLAALIIPLLLALLWAPWRRYRAGVIVGVALAFLFHITAALVLLVSVYTIAEYKAWSAKKLGFAFAGVLVAGVVPVVIVYATCLT